DEIDLYPFWNGIDFSSTGSGSWMQINFLFPPSSLFKSKTACAVEPEPAKKSNIISSLLDPSFNKCLIKFVGFGAVKNAFEPKIVSTSFEPSSFVAMSSSQVFGNNPSNSERKIFKRGIPSPPLGI